MPTIHPTAVVHPQAQLADDCQVGPFCYVAEHVVIGEGCELAHGCHITGNVTIGRHNVFHPYCCVGTPPQDVSYGGQTFAVHIGDHNVFREFVTVNMGTAKEQGLTIIGSHNYFMAYAHVAHDCVIGDHVILINAVELGGHTHVEDHANVGGLTGVHQFVTVGQHAFIGGMSRIIHDSPPYMMTEGNPARVHRVNVVGLQRHGFEARNIEALKEAHRILYRSKLTREDAFKILESREGGPAPEVRHLIAFLRRQIAGRQGRQREIIRAGDGH